MGESTSISWTDHTFNPWWGCTKVSPGCDHCYAETFDRRVSPVQIGGDERNPIYAGKHWGKGAPRREFGDSHWNEPLKWDAVAAKEGRQHKVFCASMADVMDDEAPPGARERLWALIDRTPNLLWQLLTKRPHRYETFLPETFKHGNAMLGFTGENQEFYNIRAPIVRRAARHRELLWWVSYEPALGPLRMHCMFCAGEALHAPDICGFPDWIIFGGESGNVRRECNVEWAEALLKQCRETGVKFFMKQMGGRTPAAGKAIIPIHLQIQEFPTPCL